MPFNDFALCRQTRERIWPHSNTIVIPALSPCGVPSHYAPTRCSPESLAIEIKTTLFALCLPNGGSRIPTPPDKQQKGCRHVGNSLPDFLVRTRSDPGARRPRLRPHGELVVGRRAADFQRYRRARCGATTPCRAAQLSVDRPFPFLVRIHPPGNPPVLF